MRKLMAIALLMIIVLSVSAIAQQTEQTISCFVNSAALKIVPIPDNAYGINKYGEARAANSSTPTEENKVHFLIGWNVFGESGKSINYSFSATDPWKPPAGIGSQTITPTNDAGYPPSDEPQIIKLYYDGMSPDIMYRITCTIPRGTHPGDWTKTITLTASYADE